MNQESEARPAIPKQPLASSRALQGAAAGCGCLLAIVGVLLSATLILVPVGVPLAIVGGAAAGWGIVKLFQRA